MALAIPGWVHTYSGKVRDLYESNQPDLRHIILIVASDRVSAFDHILEPAIPDKGKHLTTLTNWWFDRLAAPNHLNLEVGIPTEVAGRATIAKKLEMFPIECVVRGYITGSGWEEYRTTGEVCGIKLPQGLTFGSKLPEPIFTPAWKAPIGEHDENITFERVVELIGKDNAVKIRDLSLEVFKQASELAGHAGLILADTKFEFGIDPLNQDEPSQFNSVTGTITLGDEVLTPDSSRYWSKTAWDRGERKESFDKQIIRNWLAENWNKRGTPPNLPIGIVKQTADKYSELVERLTSEVA